MSFKSEQLNLSSSSLLLFILFLTQPLCASAETNGNTGSGLPVTTLIENNNFIAQRKGLYAIVTLKKPHLVLSTSAENGGQSKKIKYLVNHQSMEARGDKNNFNKLINMPANQYHAMIANKLKVEPELMAMMGTAANINNMAVASQQFRNLIVHAFVTAGVKGNALRASDSAKWMQGENGNEFVANKGTINIIVMINKPLTPGAMAKAAMVMTEAKSAVLRELAISSKVSPHIATGTGTDQFIIATPIIADIKPLESASGHLKLGELIGKAVYTATLEALRWQNGLERSNVRNVVHVMERFGLNEKRLFEMLKKQLPENSYQLLDMNRNSLLSEPRVAAATYAYAAVLDRIQYGTISKLLGNEALKDQSANIAVAVSSRPDCWTKFWKKIKVDQANQTHSLVRAIALGWQAKWLEKWNNEENCR